MKIRGEYWIQNGQVDFADGDTGDQNHEMIALNSIAYDQIDGLEAVARELGVDTEELGGRDDEPSQTAYHLLQAIDYTLRDSDIPTDEFGRWINKKLGINAETYEMLLGKGDARLYVMKNEGWMAVRSNNIELFGYDTSKKKQLAEGLDKILEEEGIDDPEEQIEFNLYDHKTNRSSDVTLADIKSASTFARPQQLPSTTYNKILIPPPKKDQPMGSQSPRTMTAQERQAMNTSESKLGFKQWLGKSRPKGFIVRRTWPYLSERAERADRS